MENGNDLYEEIFKSMKKYLRAIALSGLLLMASCTDNWNDPNSVKGIDITESIPIHGSTLKYFEYVVTYQDNNDFKDVDIIRDAASPARDCFVKTYRYNEYPVSCMATVELVPKVPETDVVSFTFIIPKPYLYVNIHSSSNDVTYDGDAQLPENYEEFHIQSMEIGEFLSTYGNTFISCCSVRDNLDNDLGAFFF